MEDIGNDAIYLLKKEVEDKVGMTMRAPSNFDALINEVYNTKGQTLSASTMKRLWGYVNSPHHIRVSTLTVLARYLGFRDWDDYCERKHFYTTNVSGFITAEGLQASELKKGDELAIEWTPDRYLRIRYQEAGRFIVVTSINGKLRKDDTFSASYLAVGHPLYVSDLQRDGKKMPPYVAGAHAGLTSVRLVTRAKTTESGKKETKK
jgi:hypothetical protein